MRELHFFLCCFFIYLIQFPAAFFCQEDYVEVQEDDDQPLVDSLLNSIEGDGLRCGTCSTEMNQECADPSSKTINTQICDKNKISVCRTVEYFNKKENRIHFSRGCMDKIDVYNKDACSKERLQYLFGDVRNCHVCDTDLCNINRGITVQTSKAQESFATQQPDKPDVKINSSTTLRSSFQILITVIFFALYRTHN